MLTTLFNTRNVCFWVGQHHIVTRKARVERFKLTWNSNTWAWNQSSTREPQIFLELLVHQSKREHLSLTSNIATAILKAFRIENYKFATMLHLPKSSALLNVKNLLPTNRKKKGWIKSSKVCILKKMSPKVWVGPKAQR